MKPLTLKDTEVPHWATLPEPQWKYFESFPEFLKLTWDHLGLPPPTRRQLRIARRLQGEPEGARDIVRAFRGIGKSFVTATFVIWRLMRNPRDEKVLVVSATGNKAKEFVDMVKSLLRTMPVLAGICPRGGIERDQADRFDVQGSSISQSHSVKAVGVTGQTAGSRATLIVPDDIEVPDNSRTEESRGRILSVTREFDAIILPGGDVVCLGTPQTEESVYNRLVKEQGYDCLCLPSRFPTAEKRDSYVMRRDDGSSIDILDPELVEEHEAGLMPFGAPTDPERFYNTELLKRESKGRSWFALQYQLDTSLSDAERYPLRQHDLLVFSLNPLKAPMTVQWGIDTSNRKNVINDIPNLGFSGDQLLRPLFIDDEWRPFESRMIFVDPAGRGKDETAWAVMAALNGFLYLLKVGSEVGDPTAAMQKVALDAKRYTVSMIQVEPNFGQGMWVAAFQPILMKVWPRGGATIEESEWAKGQKETRIIDTLEPVLTQHRLVVDESWLREDIKTEDRDYSFAYQLTHVTRDRGSLVHDDRLDAVAGAVGYYQRAMMMDTDQAAKAMRDQEILDEIEDFIEGFSQPTYRGIRINGQRSAVWSSDRGWSGDSRPENTWQDDDRLDWTPYGYLLPPWVP